jgi:dipeptidase E
MGETRETRIQEYHAYNSYQSRIKRRKLAGCKGETITLKGDLTARLFRQNQPPEEIESGIDLHFFEII